MEYIDYVKKLSLNNLPQHLVYIGLAVIVVIIIAIGFAVYYFRKSDNKETDIQDENIDVESAEEVKDQRNIKVVPHEFGTYTIFEINGILHDHECDTLIELAKAKGMEDSSVLSYGTESSTQLDKGYRRSQQTWFEDKASPIIQELAEYVSHISELPIENQEMLQIAHYDAGGKFDAHFDACVYEDKSFCDKINKNAGQRKLTLLIYLNDDYEGGETEFTNLNLKITPKKGKGLLFFDTDNNQDIIKESMHKAHTVTKGEKWICTKWVHFGKFTDLDGKFTDLEGKDQEAKDLDQAQDQDQTQEQPQEQNHQ